MTGINISQGNAAKRSRCGGICCKLNILYLAYCVPVKELWKSANSWRSYDRHLVAYFFWAILYVNGYTETCELLFYTPDTMKE